MEKILTSIKKQIGGIDEEVTSFDDQIVMGINMAIATLTQIGIGPSSGFMLQTKTETWSDFISDLETSARFIQVLGRNKEEFFMKKVIRKCQKVLVTNPKPLVSDQEKLYDY